MPSSVFAALVMTSAYGRGAVPPPPPGHRRHRRRRCRRRGCGGSAGVADHGVQRLRRRGAGDKGQRARERRATRRDQVRCRDMCDRLMAYLSPPRPRPPAAAPPPDPAPVAARAGRGWSRSRRAQSTKWRRVFSSSPGAATAVCSCAIERVQLALDQHADFRARRRRAVELLIQVVEIRALQVAAVDRDGRARLRRPPTRRRCAHRPGTAAASTRSSRRRSSSAPSSDRSAGSAAGAVSTAACAVRTRSTAPHGLDAAQHVGVGS